VYKPLLTQEKNMRLVALFLVAFSTLCADAYVAKDYKKLIGMQGFSDALLQMHFKLYEGYVKNANDLLTKLKSMGDAGDTSSYEYGALKRRLGWEFDGMRLHELYFDNLGGTGVLDKSSPLMTALAVQFGSYDKWKKDFIATGSMRGIGWAILYFDPQQGRLVNCWINEHDLGHLATCQPILIMDVFEHAYMPQYGLDRTKYIDAFFANINWSTAVTRFAPK
jgi:superoxide dismutase, Fe-Mn family